VSIFLKEGQQTQDGRFVQHSGGPVPHGFKVPGKIVLYSDKGEVRQCKQFNPGFTYKDALPAGSLELKGDRVTKLGTNMYSTTRPSDTVTSGLKAPNKAATPHRPTTSSDITVPDPNAKAQLDLLCKLIGPSVAGKPDSFRMNLFNDDEEEENYVSPIAQMENEGIEFMNIDARNRGRNQYLDQVMGDLNVSGGAGGDDDLLDLMDKA